MGKLEKPLTWILVVGLLGYLFMGNCCKTECSSDVKKEIRVEIQTDDESINVDSIEDAVLESIDTTDADTLIEIKINLTEE
jgi:hypothetical protein